MLLTPYLAVTMEGVACALGRPAEQDPVLQGRLRAVFGQDITPNHLKVKRSLCLSVASMACVDCASACSAMQKK